MNIKRTVVVVDDNETNAVMLKEFLMQSGFEVELAFTAQEGLRKINARIPSMVILDLVLPDMRGSEMCSMLRSNPATRDIPVILCTAYKIDPVEKMKGFRAGADDYLIRPFELAELLARMEAILRRSTVLPKTPSRPVPSAATKTQPQTFFTEKKVDKKHPPNIFKRLWEVLNTPSMVFKNLQESEDFLVAVVLVFGTPTISSLSRLLQKSGSFDIWIGVFSLGIIVNLVLWGAMGGLLHLVLPFQGANFNMRQTLTLAGLSWAPRLVEALLGLVYGVIASAGLGGAPVAFSSGLGMFPGFPSTGFISLLSQIGIFDIWSTGLILIAVWSVCRMTIRRWNSVTIIVGVSCLLLGMLAHH